MVTAQTSAGVSSQVSAGVSAAISGTTGSAPGPGGSAMAPKNRNPAASAPIEQPESETRIISSGNNISDVAVPVAASAQTANISSTPAALKKSHGRGEDGRYPGFGGFPDSTRGTAEISPSDSGTSSPLQWSPGLEFGFPDLQSGQFLNPTLNVGSPVSHPRHTHTPAGISARPGLKTQLGKPTLPKSIDQQVGLLGAH